MAQQINLLRPARQTGGMGQRIWLWLSPPLLLGLILPLGLWRWQQEQINQALLAQRQLDGQLQTRRAELQHSNRQPASSASPDAHRQRAQLLASLQSRATALGRQQGFNAPFELLASLASDGVWLTSVEFGRSEAGIHVIGQAIDPDRAMQHVELLRLRLGALGYQPQGYEISTPGAAGGTPGATTFRLY